MRALHSLPLIAALALLLGGCVSPVVIDHRAGTDFTQYRSYAIEAPDADQQALSLNGQRVQEVQDLPLGHEHEAVGLVQIRGDLGHEIWASRA